MRENSDFKILIVDDERFNIEVVVGFLEMQGYQLAYATNGVDALKAAFAKKFDLILLDINMPKMNGFEVCERLKKETTTKEVPIIFLSALNDIESITRAFKIGAVDYLSKPFNGLELIARVKTQIELRKYILELKEKQSRLAQLAVTDDLTGLSNRLHFMSIIKRETAAVSSSPSRLCLAFFSIDHMHKVNNMYGFKTGDKVIHKIGKLLTTHSRESDFAARLFGSEFVFLMPNTSLEAAKFLVKKIHDAIEKSTMIEMQITVSIGITEYQKGEEFEAFIIQSEKLMEEAKRLGGNRVVNSMIS
ncbi:MAG: diguanylate cyclase [Campylobacterota bacterium]|nr:diguanylate cyclase [Campylobacterota bacterium]